MSFTWHKAEEKEDNRQFWARIERKGIDEAGAREEIERETARERARAEEECSRIHENVAGCIAAKFSAQATLLATLGFSARKELEKAVAADCQAAQGTCTGSSAAEIKCKEVVVATPTPEGGDAKEGEKKDEKKKKGK